jgi:ribosomal protein S21
MSINAEVQKSGSEPALSTIRKFSRRVQGTGLIKAVRGGRYYSRQTSKTVKKKRALKLLKRRAEFRQLVKEGKVAEREPRRGGRPQSTRVPGRENSENTGGQGHLGQDTPIAR